MKQLLTVFASAAMTSLVVAYALAGGTQNTPQIQISNKEPLPMTTQNFATKYIELWKTTDDKQREALTRELFAEDAVHYAAPANVSFVGRENILANVTNINMGAVQKAGLKFKGEAGIANHNSILVEWSAEAPNGQTVRSGRDILILNDEGKASTLYMFTND
jgi:hypothetical protein